MAEEVDLRVQALELAFQEWRAHPKTKELWAGLRVYKASLQDQWAKGVMQTNVAEETAILNASALGEMKAINTLLELTGEQLEEMQTDDSE